MRVRKLQVLVIGVLPPPYFGPSVTFQALMRSTFPERIDVAFIDQTVSRKVSELERVQLRKLLLLVKMLLQLTGRLVWGRFDYCCLSINANRNAFLKEWLLVRVARLFGVPSVLYAHENGFAEFYKRSTPRIQRLVDDTVSRAAGAIVMGENLRFNFERWLPAEKIFVVGSGIETSEVPQRSVAADHPFTVLFLGNLIREKGVFVLLDAAPKIVAAHPQVRFVFAGDWQVESDRMEAERKIRESKLQERICFAGVVWGERKWQLLADADAFVYPTYYPLEAHPLVVVEALEAGLPVVTTRWAAIPEIIEDGVNGLLASPRDVEDLAEKVLRIIRDPAMRARMSGANRRRFQDFYTHEHYGNRMIDVFETLAAQRDRAAGAQRTATSEGPKRGGRPDVLACGRRE
ncbi:MAG: glycosyltransferase family 4 protein [Verrucomicrobiia bacterium]|jgi:glycosyltransferase involved in cell wall biosynthesis